MQSHASNINNNTIIEVDVVDSRDRKARKIGTNIERKIGKLGRKKRKFMKKTVSNKVPSRKTSSDQRDGGQI